MIRAAALLAASACLLSAAPAVAQDRPVPPPAPGLNRPQVPRPPYPYAEADVTFASPRASVTLAGTLTTPPGRGPFPAVVLVAGSGPATRDETVLGHPIFKVLADHLTRRGIVVLRYDKRGIGHSGGDAKTATTLDYADDAQAAVAFLRSRPGVDGGRIGLIGHSEGGLVGPLVAKTDPKLAFLVLLAGPGVPGRALLAAQQEQVLRASGAPEPTIVKALGLQRQVFDIAASGRDADTAVADMKAAMVGAGLPAASAEMQARVMLTPWMRSFLAYDPAPALAALRIPVLALVGSKDVQVPPAQNLPALRTALAGDRLAEVREVPDLNHLFQTATTGGVGEYGQIEETFAPAALGMISDWILATPPRR